MAAPRHRLIFIVMTILIDAIGFGLIMPVLPRLLMSVGHVGLPRAIELGSWMGLAMALATFVAAPVMGNLSDALGRRWVLLVALGGLAVDYLLLAWAGSLPLIFLGRVLSGLFGGGYGPAQAAIADITAPEDRARSFGMVGAAFGVGFVIGPALGGLLSGFGVRAPFYAACGLALANFLYGLVVFPETLKPEHRRPFTLARANPLGAWSVLRGHKGMIGAALVLLFWQVATMIYPLTWSFYGLAQLHWSERMIGLSLTAVGAVLAISQVFLVGRLVKRLGERDAASLGMVAAIAGFLAYAVITSTWAAFAALSAVAVQAVVQPSLMAMLSRRATPETQGEIQGIAAMTTGIGAIIGPLVLTWPMAWFTRADAPVFFPGIGFVIAACFALVALVLLRRLPRTESRGVERSGETRGANSHSPTESNPATPACRTAQRSGIEYDRKKGRP